MGNSNSVISSIYQVKEMYQLVIGDDKPLKSFTSFFAADDFSCECEDHDLSVYIECGIAVGPILTDQDLDDYVDLGVGIGIDPRSEFDARDMSEVLVFLGYAAELKSINFSKKNMQAEAFMYETLLYAYHTMASKLYNIR